MNIENNLLIEWFRVFFFVLVNEDEKGEHFGRKNVLAQILGEKIVEKGRESQVGLDQVRIVQGRIWVAAGVGEREERTITSHDVYIEVRKVQTKKQTAFRNS